MDISARHRRTWGWAAAGMLLLFFISRVHNLMVLPYFLDEASHITRAQFVWQGRPFYLIETGKALAPYLAAVFWPFNGAEFIGRYVVILLAAIGLASAYAVGRELHSRQAGLLCMALWIICPQLMFFERMALVDTTISAMAMLALWLAIRMVRSGRVLTAILCGVALALCVLAKLTGIVFAVIPVVVVVFVGTRLKWWMIGRQVIVAYAVMGLLLLGPFLYLRTTDADPTGQKYGLTTTRIDDTISIRMESNLLKILAEERAYFSAPMLILVAASALYLVIYEPNIILLLLALVGVLLGAISFAAEALWLRYASPAAPFMVLWTAIALVTFARQWQGIKLRILPAAFRLTPWLVAGAWALTIGLPFQLTAYADPVKLPLPRCTAPNFCDYKEYIEWITSGYGIREATNYLQATIKNPETIIGPAVDCNAARLALPYNSPITLKCYDLDWGTPENNRYVINDMEQQIKLKGHVYVLGENILIVPESMFPVPWCVVKEFRRPDPGFTVKIYYIGRGANEDNCSPEN